MEELTVTQIIIIGILALSIISVPCLSILIWFGKLGGLSVSRKGGINIASNNQCEIALVFTDQLLDDAERECKRKMFDVMYDCLSDNSAGRRHAVYMIGLNHIVRDLYSLGLDNYISKHQKAGNWTDEETDCFVNNMLFVLRTYLELRVEAYRRAEQFKVSESYANISKSKLDKNIKYLELINKYITKRELESTSMIAHKSASK